MIVECDGIKEYAIYHPETLRILEGPAKYVGRTLPDINADPSLKVSDFGWYAAHPGEGKIWSLTK